MDSGAMDLYSQHVTSTKTPHGFVNPFSGEEMPRQVALVTPGAYVMC